MEEPSDITIEEREELMVSPTGDAIPSLRNAHFLKPSFTGPKLELPSPPFSFTPTTFDLKKFPPKVEFQGQRNPQKDWKTWVDHLHCTYQSTWKKANIYEAIMGSTYHFLRDNDLVLGLAEKWCCKTNTFIFSWGEATITLEDMMILGGYPVLGDSVLSPLENREMEARREKLIEAYRQIARSKSQPAANHYPWMDYFMRSGLELEHEAFLALWLSRYVFPANLYAYVGKHLFPIAIQLARGTPIALAPAVLASLYKDLGLLKEIIVVLNKSDSGKSQDNDLSLWAPFQLLQLWAWERFPSLRPKPNVIRNGEPRVARWQRLKKFEVENVRLAIDCAAECFQWRPYAAPVTNWSFGMFNFELDKELESFARCLRICELVGLDCIEHYLPHRVSMQFGFDQDIPDYVCRPNSTFEVAWNNYNRPVEFAKSHIRPRLFEADVTTRYFLWWKQSFLSWEDPVMTNSPPVAGHMTKPSTSATYATFLNQNIDALPFQPSTEHHPSTAAATLLVVPGKTPQPYIADDRATFFNVNLVVGSNHKIGDNDNDDANTCPGFPPKDELTTLEMRRSSKKHEDVGNKPTGNGENSHALTIPESSSPKISKQMFQVSSNDCEPQVSVCLKHQGSVANGNSSSPFIAYSRKRKLSVTTTENNGTIRSADWVKEKSPMKPLEKIRSRKASTGGSEEVLNNADENKERSPFINTVSVKDYDEEFSSYVTMELELEARIKKLQQVVAGLKAKKESYKFEKKTVVRSISSTLCGSVYAV